ncbi:MAG: glycosyltransferase family 39 protein [Weeksellaceae bacterium]|nr:glycosyltransferase family 39 protein [Weeksellaceae bacterium]
MPSKLDFFLSYFNLLVATAVVTGLKVLYIVFVQKEFVGIEDFTIAKNIVTFHQYSEFINLGGTAFKLPVYPIFISLFIAFFGSKALFGVALFQAFLSFSVPMLLYKILKLFGSEKVGVLSGFLYLMSPAYFLYSGIIEATNVFVPLLLLWFFLYFKIWFSKENKPFSLVFFGLATSFLFLTQVVIVPLACLLIAGLLIFKRVNFKNLMLIICTASLFYAPWVVRNYYVFDQVVLSKTPTWQNIYFGFTPKGQLLHDLQLISAARDNSLYQMRDQNDELVMEQVYKKETLKATHGEPYFFIRKAASNLLCLWFVPPKYFEDHSLQVLLGRKIYVLILDLLTAFSLFYLYRRSKIVFWFSLLFFANFSFPYMIGHAANMRFKLDFEWYQLVLAAFLLLEVFGDLQSAKKRHCVSALS